MPLGIFHALNKIKNANESVRFCWKLDWCLHSPRFQENFSWPRKAFLFGYCKIPYLRSRDANVRGERLEFVQKVILKLGLVAISESHYFKVTIWPKFCIMITRKQLWYKLIIGLYICLFSLSLHNAPNSTPTHYHPLHSLLIFPFEVSRNALGHFHSALITAFAADKRAQPGFSPKSTFCFKILLFFTCKPMICQTLISFSSHNVFSIFKGNSTNFIC